MIDQPIKDNEVVFLFPFDSVKDMIVVFLPPGVQGECQRWQRLRINTLITAERSGISHAVPYYYKQVASERVSALPSHIFTKDRNNELAGSM